MYDIQTNPLAISSLSVGADGRFAMGASLDGTVALVDVNEGKIVGSVETAREKVGGGSGEFFFSVLREKEASLEGRLELERDH
jgi:hypothetical protein